MLGFHEAMLGLHKAMLGLHEAMIGLHEAMIGLHEAMIDVDCPRPHVRIASITYWPPRGSQAKRASSHRQTAPRQGKKRM